MILDEITFTNFGVYGGRQVLKLTPPSCDRPIILIGGFNGGGKTTMLDGLQLALYGKNAHCSNRGELPYHDYLRKCLHRGADPQQGASIEIRFRHTTDAAEHTYNVKRGWAEFNYNLEERVEVRRDGVVDGLLTDQWSEHVETFIPTGLSELFFFDGEKIEQLADVANSARTLSVAIHSLLGIELVDQLAADLGVLERRKRFVAKSDATQNEIKELNDDIRRIEELWTTAFNQQASLRNEVDMAEKAVAGVKDHLRRAGGDLLMQREQMEVEKTTVGTRLKTIKQKLRELAAGSAPLLLVQELLEEVARQADNERHTREARILNKFLRRRDARLVRALKTSKAPHRIVNLAENFLSEDLKKLDGIGQAECYLDFDEKTSDELRVLRRSGLSEVKKQANQLLVEAEQLQKRLTVLEQQLNTVPDAGALEPLKIELKEAESHRTGVVGRYENLEARLQQLTKEKQQKQANREALLMNLAEEHARYEADVRIIHHSEKVRATLQKFRVAVVQRHISKIEQAMLDSIRQLLRKRTLISEIKIDPSTFGLALKDGRGDNIQPARLSAGERQLLAISMLWGLGRASGRPLPTIIDTPLGRLDAHHRDRLIERYFPHASHQVILLSTDEEIAENYFSRLKHHVGHAYQLRFDDKTQSTTILPGYFWS